MLNQILQTRIRLSTLALVTVAMFDLVTTLFLLSRGFQEANPLFAWLVTYGSFPFTLFKLIFLFGPILILESVRKARQLTAEFATWLAFALYFSLYTLNLLLYLFSLR